MKLRHRSAGQIVAAIVAAAALPSCVAVNEALVDAKGKPDFAFTGIVYDKSTMQPIEGAYVVAIYHADAGPPPAYKTWCVKTLGMYTGKDGKFSFPVTRNDGRSPMMASAIKTGYYRAGFDVPRREAWQKQDAATYSNRNIYLLRQDKLQLSFQLGSGEEYCPQALTAEDASAGLTFLQKELEELKRIGAPSDVISAAEYFVNSREGRSQSLTREAPTRDERRQ